MVPLGFAAQVTVFLVASVWYLRANARWIKDVTAQGMLPQITDAREDPNDRFFSLSESLALPSAVVKGWRLLLRPADNRHTETWRVRTLRRFVLSGLLLFGGFVLPLAAWLLQELVSELWGAIGVASVPIIVVNLVILLLAIVRFGRQALLYGDGLLTFRELFRAFLEVPATLLAFTIQIILSA